MSSMPFTEKYLSELPAVAQLMKLGFEYLSPEEVRRERNGRLSNVLLEGILRERLKELNRIRYHGEEYRFSEENIQSAIQRLKNVKYDGRQRTNEVAYDLLTLGVAAEQTIDGVTRSFPLVYVDWNNVEANRFHVATQFPVERERSPECAKPDIVLFVNGIPFAVIECKAPGEDLSQAVSQMLRNQGDEYIPRLFAYVQIVLGVNKNAATYATAGTPAKFWSIWKEMEDRETAVEAVIHRTMDVPQIDALFSHEYSRARGWFKKLETERRLVTSQDKAIHSLLRPERLLELAYKFIVFEGGIKKIARYQQYFFVKSTLGRIVEFDGEGRRRGGIAWHTQGSGKSLTQVMLARNLALGSIISNPRIILVTDRDELDKQLGNTFAACGLSPARATSGKNLLELLGHDRASIVTTLIHKFAKAREVQNYRDDSTDIFLLVDEGHRTNYGSFAARMRQMFPRACYIGFTGTPLLKKEKNSFAKFGGLIEPHYSIRQAVEDGAVLPLLYEGRLVDMRQDKEAIDVWFERHTATLSPEQKADLKRKYSRAEMLEKADRVVYMRAFDISAHFVQCWQGTPFKAQLVAPNKLTALKYKRYLDELGDVSSEVVISPPDVREGYEEAEDSPTDEVLAFWQKMMNRYGNEDGYTKSIIDQFKYGEAPEILIVVDKLLTGFDAPRNTVLYLCRVLREHTLLQAIARVNRLYEGKEYGYIVDYSGCLGELDKALTMYEALEEFDEVDLLGALTGIEEEVRKLPQRHSDLWDIFKTLRNSDDEEAFERFLADDDVRTDFYHRLTAFLKTLAIALSSERFLVSTNQEKIDEYRGDLRRFQNLRLAVQRRYAETVNYKDYEPRIKKLLDTHISANSVTSLNEPVNIFNDSAFWEVKSEQGIYGSKAAAAKADTIAHATKRTIHERMDEDPSFYERFSELIQKTIDDFRAQRISELEYLEKVSLLRDDMEARRHENVPEKLAGRDHAIAFYGALKPRMAAGNRDHELAEICAQDSALAIEEILKRHWKVHFWDDPDAENQVRNDMDDFFFDVVKGARGLDLGTSEIDVIMDEVLRIARHRMR